jgi:hypothetical protein
MIKSRAIVLHHIRCSETSLIKHSIPKAWENGMHGEGLLLKSRFPAPVSAPVFAGADLYYRQNREFHD